jgi:hypothetical protein
MDTCTVELLDQMVAEGFTDPAFQVVHHWGPRARIHAHRAWAEHVSEFKPNGTNVAVARRLKLMWNAYQHGGFKSGKPEVWAALAIAAKAEIE